MTLLWTAGPEADPGLWGLLPPWKAAELLRRRSGEARRQSLLGWALLEAVLGPSLALVERLPGGKPYLRGGPEFSLSHCPALAVLALSEVPVGVDVEPSAALEPAWARDWTARESRGKLAGGPPAAAPPEGPALWTGSLGGCVLSVCVCSGAAAPERMIEWDGKRYVG